MSDNLRTRYKKKLEAILGESKPTTFSEMLRGNLIQIFFKVGKGYINFLVPVERHGIQGAVDHSLESCPSGYHLPTFVEQVIKKEFFKQPLGLICQNKGCGLSTSELIGQEKMCSRCHETGYPTSSFNRSAKISCPVRTLSLQPELLVTLICRRSKRQRVPRTNFTELQDFVFNKMR